MTNLLKILGLLFILPCALFAQECTTRGQTPATAFPVCGTATFHQGVVPQCGIHILNVPGCSGDPNVQYGDLNPYWYKFTCFQSGTLSFLITPKNLGDDYDWQLYDITNHDPEDVFTDKSLVVTGNWSGSYGKTGASNSGVSFIQCASDPRRQKTNTFAKMPQLVAGHTYLLLVSHFSGDSQSGYDLSFGGGTAVITDTTQPHLKSVETNCDNNLLRLKLNKHILCKSIAPDGSDFTINAPGVTVTSSTGINCSEKFDTDSLLLQLSAPLPPGTYTLSVKNGSDGNTLLDFCENAIPTSDGLSIVINPKVPTPMDSMAPLPCAPQQIHLLFKKPIQCTSIAANGSDFAVSGSYPVSVVSAAGTCAGDGLTKEIIVTLDKPLQQAGSFRLTLQQGSDGSTVEDECGLETPAGSSLSFSVKDTVSADFDYAVKYGCVRDTIAVFHNGANSVTSWTWNLDDRQRSNLQNAQGIYTAFTEKNISLIASNGFCSDTVSKTVLLDNYLKADFTAFPDQCPNEPATFTGNPQGKIKTHNWDFGDGGTASTQESTHTYQTPPQQRTFNVRYTVTDSFNCQNTAVKPITVYTSCYVAVPTAFTPNGDGLNDFLAPMNAVKAINLEFRIYNRWGQLVYASSDWKRGWDGTIKGQPQPTATYVWMLQYTDRDTGKQRLLKGTAVLIR